MPLSIAKSCSAIARTRPSNASGTCQMTRSLRKSAHQGKPHMYMHMYIYIYTHIYNIIYIYIYIYIFDSGGTLDARCRSAVPKAPDCGLLFPTCKPGHFAVRSFPGNLGHPKMTQPPHNARPRGDSQHETWAMGI